MEEELNGRQDLSRRINPAEGALSRREFLKGILLLSGGIVLVACSPEQAREVETSGWITPTPAQVLPVIPTQEGEAAGEQVENLPEFLALSALLTGMPDLDADLGAAFLQAFQAVPGFSAGLDQLIEQAGLRSAQPPADLQALEATGIFSNKQSASTADQIINAWYSGMVETDEEPIVVTFVDALAWKALHFTKPLTICANYAFWEEKPAYNPPEVRYWQPEGDGGSE